MEIVKRLEEHSRLGCHLLEFRIAVPSAASSKAPAEKRPNFITAGLGRFLSSRNSLFVDPRGVIAQRERAFIRRRPRGSPTCGLGRTCRLNSIRFGPI
ncbi:hypothetical protein Zmor_016816 [Zophobas morio]|uniref:Uncharacterized protein n=1 Tax=Zophobas morio TaxID=2755281 RepID=A0AA38I8C0_9CUCU|nr:hypothetical protein Zmor_016816 [Zophobas morio]